MPTQSSEVQTRGAGATTVIQAQTEGIESSMILQGRSKSVPAPLKEHAAPVKPLSHKSKKVDSCLPKELTHLISILEGLEAVLSLKRSGRAKHVLCRADKSAVEHAARRDFKVSQVLQLKTLLGDAMELQWVTPPMSQRGGRTSAGVKDLDLAIRFHVPHPSDVDNGNAKTPSRGRSATRCQITASSGSPVGPQQGGPSTDPDTPLTSQDLQQQRDCASSQLKAELLSRMSQHIVATQPQLQQAASLYDVVNHSAWDPSAYVVIQPAELPPRPSQLSKALSSSRGATPVRCGSTATVMTPSPSIRSRTFSTQLFPSPALTTPDSKMRAHQSSQQQQALQVPANGFFTPKRLSPPADALGSVQRAAAECTDKDDRDASPLATNRVLFHEVGTPCRKTAAARATPQAAGRGVLARARVSQTPGKRKRDNSQSPVSHPSDASTAFLKTPMKTPSKSHGEPSSAMKAQRTPGVACVPHTQSAGVSGTVTPVISPVKGGPVVLSGPASASSPALRKQLVAMSTSSMFADRLPVISSRTPKAKGKASASVPTTPQNDAYGKRAHCQAALVKTPDSAESTKTQSVAASRDVDGSVRRTINFVPQPSPTKPASEQAFYTSPTKPRGTKQVEMLKTKVLSFSRTQQNREGAGRLLKNENRAEHNSSDAACLAASIMDDDMMQLLARNQKNAEKDRIAQEPSNKKHVIEEEAKRSLTATYDVVRAVFQTQHSLVVQYDACVDAIDKTGLPNQTMSEDAAGAYLDVLAASVPEWITVSGTGDSRTVRIARMCTGVRQKLEKMSRAK